jgi:L-fucose isomerase-like protein
MEKELGEGNKMPGILPKLAQYELTLLDWAEKNKGSRQYVVFANKCWPAFQTEFGFVPCYVNSRLAARGIPVACEVDIYGALSEYIGTCATATPVTLLDINNTVPADLHASNIEGKFPYSLTDTFMGFHCGNTPICRLNKGELKFQRIMHRLLEPGKQPDITRGTLEGDIAAGPITFFRLQSNAAGELKAYVAQGEVLPVATQSFGGIGIFAIPEMGRFYRHVLIAGQYPHHGAVAFGHAGKTLYDVFAYLGIPKISYNQPKGLPYPTENPFV